MKLDEISICYAMTGSFCTFSKSIKQLKLLAQSGANIIPIMSQNACSIDTRFGKAADIVKEVESICGRRIINSIQGAEPIGPKKMADILVISPCTGNTLAKLNNAITDTSVTMAAKSHLRIGRPLVITLATNDGLGATARNVGNMLNKKNIYFTPLKQDDHINKPNSLVANFELLIPTIKEALGGKQIQPVFYN